MVALFLLGGFAQTDQDVEARWSAFARASAVETQKRRPDLVPFRSQQQRPARGDWFETMQAVHHSWWAGRRAEAIGVLRRAVRDRPEDGGMTRTLGRMLAQTGEWAEARDLLGVNLDGDTMAAEPFLYALVSVEAGTPSPELDGLYRARLSCQWKMGPGELARLYPATRDGLRRMAWVTYASVAVAHAPFPNSYVVKATEAEINSLDQEPRAEEFPSYVPIQNGEAGWAMGEAYRRYPDDPVAAYWTGQGGTLYHDSLIVITTLALRKEKVDRLKRIFGPALLRLRPGDAFDRILRQMIESANRSGTILKTGQSPRQGPGLATRRLR